MTFHSLDPRDMCASQCSLKRVTRYRCNMDTHRVTWPSEGVTTWYCLSYFGDRLVAATDDIWALCVPSVVVGGSRGSPPDFHTLFV